MIEERTCRVTFSLEGDTFYHAERVETVSILKAVANKIENGMTKGAIIDYNGNPIGSFAIEGEA